MTQMSRRKRRFFLIPKRRKFMRRSTNKWSWLVQAVVGVVMIASAKAYAADAPAAKWYDTIAASGYLQGSYTGNFENSSRNKTSQLRQFDTNGNSFNYNAFLLQIAKPVGD